MTLSNFVTIFFNQIVTVHCYKNEDHVLLSVCLLPDKNTDTYVHAFKIILGKHETDLGIHFGIQFLMPSETVSDRIDIQD